MALYLVQHGKAHPAEIDPERGLSDEGRAEVERIASVAHGYGVPVRGIIHSGKKRAFETANIFAAALGTGIMPEQTKGMDPTDDVIAFSARLDERKNQMFVGHLPFMEYLVSFLVAGTKDRPVFKFQNGGIVCLDRHPAAGTWIIVWALMPHIG